MPKIKFYGTTFCERDGEFEGRMMEIRLGSFIFQIGFGRQSLGGRWK